MPSRDKKNKLPNSFSADYISYEQTGYFSKIVTDYLSQSDQLTSFYRHPASIEGIKNAIAERKKYKTNRKLLTEQLQSQYTSIQTSDRVIDNIKRLADENTFTICTAHQPNIFTGHLYFIYKIIHAIKLADELNKELPGNYFVPVFYMGSEDADIEELGHIYLFGEKYEWKTKQTGAVGRMKVDDQLLQIIKKISGRLSVEPYGKEILQHVEKCYVKNETIEQATFRFVNELFQDYGLVVLMPDNAELKRTMVSVFEDDIFDNKSSEIVNKTSQQLSEHYKVQAHPREINLFYLKDDVRERIIRTKTGFQVNDTDIKFSEDELKKELNGHPERFSPNVILRSLYQETILPNVAFVGGGGELAYWLELKDLFANYKVPFPVLILRNSFMIINKNISETLKKLSFGNADIFKTTDQLINELVTKNSTHQLNLKKEKEELTKVYEKIQKSAESIDPTLVKHVVALLTRDIKKLDVLEKKFIKAEKRKFDAQLQQVKKLHEILFPHDQLQERIENFLPYYAKWCKEFMSLLYNNSFTIEQKFCIIHESS